jgi:hypothetical protein
MTPEHPNWDDFYGRLIEGLEDESKRQRKNNPEVQCPIARRVLKGMGYGDAVCEASILYFATKGGYSDLEVLLNVDNG